MRARFRNGWSGIHGHAQGSGNLGHISLRGGAELGERFALLGPGRAHIHDDPPTCIKTL